MTWVLNLQLHLLIVFSCRLSPILSILWFPWFFTCMLSHFSHVQLFVTPWTIACQAPLSMDSPGQNTGVVAILFSRVFT